MTNVRRRSNQAYLRDQRNRIADAALAYHAYVGCNDYLDADDPALVQARADDLLLAMRQACGTYSAMLRDNEDWSCGLPPRNRRRHDS